MINKTVADPRISSGLYSPIFNQTQLNRDLCRRLIATIWGRTQTWETPRRSVALLFQNVTVTTEKTTKGGKPSEKEERKATAQVVVVIGRLVNLFVCRLKSLSANTVFTEMDPSTTILRVKRKRGTDPADALLLACKRIRPEATAAQPSDESEPEPQEPKIENSVFKLVATVVSQVMYTDAVCCQEKRAVVQGFIRHILNYTEYNQ